MMGDCMACKGICGEFAVYGGMFKGAVFRDGRKYCRECGIYVITQDLRCSCCHRVMRVKSPKKKPRNRSAQA